MIRIGNKETQAIITGLDKLSDDQFQLATLASQLKLDPKDYRPLIQSLDEPASMTVEQVSQEIEKLWKQKQGSSETTGGPTSIDSPALPESVTSETSPTDSSTTERPEPSNDPPSVPPPSALLQAS